jgi:hypothetical protein
MPSDGSATLYFLRRPGKEDRRCRDRRAHHGDLRGVRRTPPGGQFVVSPDILAPTSRAQCSRWDGGGKKAARNRSPARKGHEAGGIAPAERVSPARTGPLLAHDQLRPAITPPSTSQTAPVTHPASSESRKSIVLATSSARRRRPPLDDRRDGRGPNVFQEIAAWALSPLKPLQEVLGLR